MTVSPPLPLLKRLPPGGWAALAWCVGGVLTFVFRVRLPGESGPADWPASQLYRWDGLTTLALATALTLTGCALLSRRPLAALWWLLAGAALAPMALAVGAIPLLQFLAVVVAVHFVAAAGPRRTGIVALVLALAELAGYLAVRALAGWTISVSTELAVALTTVIAWLAGNSSRQAHAYAERLSAQSTAQAVTAERLRIAREMHDMVAHTVGIVALQAGAARRVIDTQPERARDALSEVETASRETLAGLRRMLGALRRAPSPDAPGAGSGADSGAGDAGAPDGATGLAALDRLAETVTAAGVRVDVRRHGAERALPPELDMAAHRIVQESVTNVVRHAAATSCRVTVGLRRDALELEIVDEGRGHGHGHGSDTGYGLAGMRERVALLHGTFEAGPRPSGGFRVAATLPLPLPPASAPAPDRSGDALLSGLPAGAR